MKHNASNMTRTLLFMVAWAVLIGPFARAAEDGAALYKQRCAGCHGAKGEGKPTVKAPSLQAAKMDANQITVHLTKGEPGGKPPHNKAISGLKPEQAKAIAEFVKTL